MWSVGFVSINDPAAVEAAKTVLYTQCKGYSMLMKKVLMQLRNLLV
jgi:hypothetical protein